LPCRKYLWETSLRPMAFEISLRLGVIDACQRMNSQVFSAEHNSLSAVGQKTRGPSVGNRKRVAKGGN
jgi:hypothetical protein